MPRDLSSDFSAPSLEAISSPFIDFYPLESQEYIFAKSHSIISSGRLTANISRLITERSTLGLRNTDSPHSISLNDYQSRWGKRLSYDASSFFVVGKSYFTQASSVTYETSPVLYYYGFMFLHSSLQNMFYRVPNKKGSHGLTIVWPMNVPEDNASLSEANINAFLDGVKVEISPYGAFARTRDFYTIMNQTNIFSLYLLDKSSNTYLTNPSPLITNLPVTISLKDIFNYQYNNNGFNPNMHDLVTSELLWDYLALFAMSSIARYRPTLWRIVSSGKGQMLPDILGLYRRVSCYAYTIHDLLHEQQILS